MENRKLEKKGEIENRMSSNGLELGASRLLVKPSPTELKFLHTRCGTNFQIRTSKRYVVITYPKTKLHRKYPWLNKNNPIQH